MDIHPDFVGNHTVLGGIARVVDPFAGVAEITVTSKQALRRAALDKRARIDLLEKWSDFDIGLISRVGTLKTVVVSCATQGSRTNKQEAPCAGGLLDHYEKCSPHWTIFATSS